MASSNQGRPRLSPQPNAENFQPVGLAGGIDTKTDYKLVQAPNTLQALNVRYGTAGSVRKRYGQAALGTLTGAISCLATQGELLACDSANMYAVNVGTGALTTRGIVGAASVASQNIASIGTLPTQTLRSMQLEYLTVGGVTYGLAAYEYGTSPQSGQGTNVNGMDIGFYLYLVLFNATTGATIWTTNTLGIPLSSSIPLRLINPAGTVTYTSLSNSSAGVFYPCITVYNGQFIVSWIAASISNQISDSGTTLSGAIYSVQSITFVPSATIPISGTTLNSNAAMASPFPAVIAGQPSSASSAYSPTLPIPLAYDIRTSGTDVLLFATGQNYGAVSGTTPVLYRTVGALALYSNASTFVAPNVTAVTPPVTSSLNTPTLAPGTGVYGLQYRNTGYAQLLLPTYSPSAALAVQTSASYGNVLPNTPLSCVFAPGPTLPTFLIATDGAANILAWSLVYGTAGNIATIGFNSVATASSIGNTSLDCSNAPSPGNSAQIVSRCFMWNGTPMVWVNLSTLYRSTEASLALMPLSTSYVYNSPPAKAIAHAAYLRTFTPGVPTDTNAPVPVNAFPMQAANVSFNAPSGSPTTAYAANTNSQEYIVSLKSLTVNADTVGTSRQSIRTPQGILYLGADPKYYDGNTCRTMGWLKIPEFGTNNGYVVATSALQNYKKSGYGASLGLMPGATYTFFFVFVDYDAQGNVIYGSPSPAFQTSVGASGYTYVLFIPQQMIPSRGYLQVYRNTPLNPLSYVKTRQFAQSDIAGYGTGFTGVIDDTGLGTGGATETLSGGLLYAPPSGGEIGNDPPPPCSMGCATKQRIFLVSQEVPTWVYFSKPFYAGRAPEFNAGQLLDIDPPTGPITGIAALDTTIVVFKATSIYSFSGDGPDATGSGTFTPTSAIATDTGCIDPASVLTTEQGVWFRSRRGLEMLSRGGQVAYQAPQVESLLTGTTVIASAILPAQNQLHFSLANGNVLVYDYLLSAWSVFVYLRPSTGTTSSPCSYAQLNGSVYTVNTSGDLCAQTSNFVDGATGYPSTLQSAWINVAGPQGWGRIRRVSVLGDFRSAHTLNLSFSYDFSSTPAYSIPYTASTAAQQSPYNWRVRAPRQVCQSVQFTLTDNAPAGEGAVITGLVVELGPKSQALRVPDTQSM